MKDLKTGPFKRTIEKKNKPIKTNNGIITFALILLTITQIPIAFFYVSTTIKKLKVLKLPFANN